jgi:sporulation protein YlmC with PRC-barrel domain
MTDVVKDETMSLIASNKVEGTSVYNPSGEKLGSIYNFMVDKTSGQVEYAVLQFGGILGLGSDYYPLPWDVLTYDEEQGGYVVELSKEVLEKAPHYPAKTPPQFTTRYGGEIYGAYGLPYPGSTAPY